MLAFSEVKPMRTRDTAHESFPYFDWLRFGLASVVALYHGGNIAWGPAGNFAVQVFFALSGWLIGGILLRSERKDLTRFYFNRATRIWIPYFIAVGVLYGVAAVHTGVDRPFIRCLIFDSTFTHNWFISPLAPMPLGGTGNHFWSISVEEQFYLASPLLIVLLPFGRSILLWLLLALAAVASQFWYGSIALGVLAAVIRCRCGDWQFSRPGIVALLAGGAILTAIIVAFPSSYGWVSSPLATIIVLALSRSGGRSAVGEFFGGVSYPLYLYHWVGLFAAAFVGHRWIRLPSVASYAFAVACGVMAYMLIDRNVMRRRSHFYSPTVGRTLMIIAYFLLGTGLIAGAALG